MGHRGGAGHLAIALAALVTGCGGEAPPELAVEEGYVLPGGPDDPWDLTRDGLSFKLRRAHHCGGLEIPGTSELTYESVEVLVAPTVGGGRLTDTVEVALGAVALAPAPPDGAVWRFVAYREEELEEGSEVLYGIEGQDAVPATPTGLVYRRAQTLSYLR